MNGSILIPEKFRLNGKTIKVIVDDDYCKDEKCLGEADFSQKLITLASICNGKKIRKADKEKTFFHELVHMILDSMGEDRLKYNEQFVDDFALLLYEFEKSKI
jgi:hypothetical protein